MGARSTLVRWQEICCSISSISNRSNLCLLNLSCAQIIFNMCVSSSSKHILLILHCKRAPFPACGNAMQVHVKLSSAEAPYSCCISPFLPSTPTIQHQDDPGTPMVALSKALDEADVAISIVDLYWGVSMLSARSPFLSTSASKQYQPIPSTLLTITTPSAQASSLSGL